MAEDYDKAERSRMVGYALRAFVIAMIVIDLLAAGAAFAQIAKADDPATCDHRGYMHITRHGGKLADDEWHERHGQAKTCDDDKNKDDPERDTAPEEPRHLPGEDERHDDHHEHGDGHTIPKRDHEGYHCTVLGCG
jgi:hypothetical protein